MKIVIPTAEKGGLGDKVAPHFGRCNTYTFLNEKGKLLEIIDNTSEHMGGKGLPPQLMQEHGANILLCKDLGPRALDLCAKLGIEIYCSEAITVKEIFEKWKNNKLKKASLEDVCNEHKI
jgi:predicted Fe-Mo cluster-binding NifX family protein